MEGELGEEGWWWVEVMLEVEWVKGGWEIGSGEGEGRG